MCYNKTYMNIARQITNERGVILLKLEFVCIISLIVLTIFAIYQNFLILKHKKMLNGYEKVRKRLYETSEKISKINDEDTIYSIVLDAVVDLIPNACKGSVLLFNHEDEKFYYKASKGYSSELENFSIKKEEAYLYKINRFKETAIIKNPKEFDLLNTHKETIEGLDRMNALDISCSLCAPIYADERFMGIINVDSNMPGHVFTQKDLNLMNQIKLELELTIKNALAQNKLKYLANYDELTGLINRRKLMTEFNKEFDRMKIVKKPMSLVMIDLDDFKCINDNYGHYFGDLVLKKFSEILAASAGKSNVVARFAGDEFVVLFIEHDYKMAENKMKNIREMILTVEIDNISLSFSYGICEVCSEHINFEKALVLADANMYKDKKVKIC